MTSSSIGGVAALIQ